MSLEKILDELSSSAMQAVRGLLRDAYDRGYREALSSLPEAVSAHGQGAPLGPPSATEDVDAGGAGHDGAAAVDWRDHADEEEEEEAATTRAVAPQPIMPHATVGTLRKRIVRMFDLERFDIDVVICRRGDRDRRQLKSTAKLGLYRREER